MNVSNESETIFCNSDDNNYNFEEHFNLDFGVENLVDLEEVTSVKLNTNIETKYYKIFTSYLD